MRNLQDIFNIAYRGLEAQGFERSVGYSSLSCKYRDPNSDRKCAIGHVIPDDMYREEYDEETMTVYGLAERLTYNEWTALFGLTTSDTLAELQKVHDNSTDPDNMKQGLADFAKAHNLLIPAEPLSPA